MVNKEALGLFILGSTGQFGKPLCRRLIKLDNVKLYLVGRKKHKLEDLKNQLFEINPSALIEIVVTSIEHPNFINSLNEKKPYFLLHLAGPFQDQNFKIARACITAGISYMDISDGRAFVEKFNSLDEEARKNNVVLITGASTVPSLCAAVVDSEIINFQRLDKLEYGIVTGLKAGLGIATLQAVFSYCGKPFTILKDGKMTETFGFNNLREYKFPEPLGRRTIVDCDIPDLDIFPKRYPTLQSMIFGAGTDASKLIKLLHYFGKYIYEKKVLVPRWLAKFIMPFTKLLKLQGSPHSGFFVVLEGLDSGNSLKRRLVEIIAFDNSGLEIPITPIVILIKKALQGKAFMPGAYSCVGLYSLSEFERELAPYPIYWVQSDLNV